MAAVELAHNTQLPLPPELSEKDTSTKSYAQAAIEGLEKHSDNTDADPPNDEIKQSYVLSDGKWQTEPAKSREQTEKDDCSTATMDKQKVDGDGNTLVEEQFKKSNGQKLTTIKPDDSYEDQMRLDKGQERRPLPGGSGHELVSGYRAGSGWERSKIRWAPFNVPLKRRLQMAAVLLHSVSIALFVSTFFFLAAIPLTWPLLFPYTCYVLFSSAGTDGTLSRRSPFVRSLPIWSLFASYFPARLHRSQPLPATRKYVFGYHPHGIISHGAFAAFATEALGFSQLFPGITNTLLTLDSNFRLPFYRDWALALGLMSVSRDSCENLLSKGGSNGEGMGRAVTIVVGGARESLDAVPGRLKLVLGRRKGFVRLAVRAGADLVPVLGFGENELYDQVRGDAHPLVHRLQLLLKKVAGFTVPLFFARGVFNYDVGLMPYRRPLNIVVGRPIKVLQSEEPDPKYIDHLHARYISELERLWRNWRGEFAPHMEGDMEIVE